MAAVENALLDLSFKTTTDLSAKQFYAVKLSAADTVALNDAAGTEFGILQNKPTANHAAQVRVMGVSKWVSDGNAGAISVGDRLGSDGNGKAIQVSADHDTVLAYALSASTADGTIIDVLVSHHQISTT